MTDITIEFLKRALKPGFLYGIGNDGELYCVEVQMPDKGKTIVIPPMYMPEDDEL